MTHEQYITLETARLAKQAGFDWEVGAYWISNYANGEMQQRTPFENRVIEYDYNNEPGAKYKKGNMLSAPTQAVLQRWLREGKGIAVFVVPAKHNGEFMWFNSGYKVDDESATEILFDNNFFTTYEAALEAGLQKCLKFLIE